MRERSARPVKPPLDKPQGTLGRTLSWTLGVVGALLLAVAVSVLIEMTGIALGWWPDDHAAILLRTERGYLEPIDRVPLTGLSPLAVSYQADARLNSIMGGVRRNALDNRNRDRLAVYVLAMINTVKLLALRFVVCLFSLPGYGLVAIAALVDGGVARDIRKYTGGHESSYVFHKAKRWVVPGIVGTVSLYLLLPFSLLPALVFAPSMALFGVMVYISAARFKKFL